MLMTSCSPPIVASTQVSGSPRAPRKLLPPVQTSADEREGGEGGKGVVVDAFNNDEDVQHPWPCLLQAESSTPPVGLWSPSKRNVEPNLQASFWGKRTELCREGSSIDSEYSSKATLLPMCRGLHRIRSCFRLTAFRSMH